MGNVFDIRDYPAARNTDPETSHKAEQILTFSGKRVTRQHYVLYCVARHPGKTSNDYFHLYIKQAFPLTDYAAWSSRFTECRNADLLYNQKAKTSEFTKSAGITWHPTEKLLARLDELTEHVQRDLLERLNRK